MTEQLPSNSVKSFVEGAKKHRRPQSGAKGGFLQFNGKSGEWTFGQEEVSVTGESVLVLAESAQHGFIQWGVKPPEKVFASIQDPVPAAPDSVEGPDRDTGEMVTYYPQDARQFMGAFFDEDLGQFQFSTSSMGGVENVDSLFDAIVEKAATGSEFYYPEVELANEFYKRSTGKVFKPVFDIVRWCDVNGNPEDGGKSKKSLPPKQEREDSGEEEEAQPKRRRRRA
jgi:hypothetical protein